MRTLSHIHNPPTSHLAVQKRPWVFECSQVQLGSSPPANRIQMLRRDRDALPHIRISLFKKKIMNYQFHKQAVTARWHVTDIFVQSSILRPVHARLSYFLCILFLPKVHRALVSAQMCCEQRVCFLKYVNDVTQDFDSLTAEGIQYFQNICNMVSKHCRCCWSTEIHQYIYADMLLCHWDTNIAVSSYIFTFRPCTWSSTPFYLQHRSVC